MTPEDRLSRILMNEADRVLPAGDGLSRIQAKIARRRRRRMVLLPAAVLGAAAAAITVALVGNGSGVLDSLTHIEQPAANPPNDDCGYNGVSDCGGSVVQTPRPTPATTPSEGRTPGSATVLATSAFWPFGSPDQARGWATDHGNRPWAGRPADVVKHFATDLLGLTGVSVSQPKCASPCDDRVTLSVGGVEVGRVKVVQLVAGGPWSVTSVSGSDLTISSPASGAAVVTPTIVTGRVQGVDENVRLRLLSTAGTELASVGAPAGSAVPWSGTLTWKAGSWTTAGIVATTYSAKDGSLNRLTVVPVRRGTAVSGSTFVGITGGHVMLYDASTGKALRQLTFPPKGSRDTWVASGGGTVAWVRQKGACSFEVDRLVNGAPERVRATTTNSVGQLAVSDSGSALAWDESGCGSSTAAGRVVVQVAGAPATSRPDPANTSVADVRDNGTLLVVVGGAGPKVGVLPITATSFSQQVNLAVASGCDAGAPAWDGATAVAWEVCSSTGRARLLRFSASGARLAAGPVLAGMELPNRTSVRSGQVLLWLFGGDVVGPVARYSGGRMTTVVPNNGCSSTSALKGCVQSATW